MFITLSVIFSDLIECNREPRPCDANATCNNTVGSFTCACNDGYTGDGETCEGEFQFQCKHLIANLRSTKHLSHNDRETFHHQSEIFILRSFGAFEHKIILHEIVLGNLKLSFLKIEVLS